MDKAEQTISAQHVHIGFALSAARAKQNANRLHGGKGQSGV